MPLPNHGKIDATLVGRKVEMAWKMEVKGGEDFVHVFEGTIQKVVEQAKDMKVRSVHGVRSKWAVAKVKWDDLFKEADTWHPLNVDLYEKQDGKRPKHEGWRLLSQEYVDFCARIERSLTQHGPKQKRQ